MIAVLTFSVYKIDEHLGIKAELGDVDGIKNNSVCCLGT